MRVLNERLQAKIRAFSEAVRDLDRELEIEAVTSGREIALHADRLDVYREKIRAQNRYLQGLLAELVDAQERYLDLYDAAPFAYVTLDADGGTEEINLRGAEMLGRERGHLTGIPFSCHVDPGSRDAFLAHMQRCRRSLDETVVSELEIVTRSHERIPVELHSRRAKARGESGDPMFRTCIIDLSERKQAERERDELLLRERVTRATSEAKDRFLMILSHELRTPLTPALLSLAELEEQAGLDDEAASNLRRARHNVELEARLIDDLLDVTRIGHGKLRLDLEVVDLHDILLTAVEMCAPETESRRLALVEELEATAHHVHGDPTRMQQIFLNLLRNACKYTPPGGTIEVRTRDAEDGVVAEVRDTGRGMDRRTRERIFEAFEQGQLEVGDAPGGLGLGLTIAKGLVELHQGRITAHSAGPGTGSSFEVRLPTAPAGHRAAVGDEEASRPGPVEATAGLRILLVEDHPDTAETMATLLQHAGYEVRVAASVRSAVELAGESPVDVLIADIALPDGSGADVLAAHGDLPAIAVSGYGSEDDVRRSHQAGFDRHLTKPIHFPDLVATIEQVRGAKGPEPVRR